MAKRRAEDTLLPDSGAKRCYRSMCSVDLQLESVPPVGGVSPPSLLALLGNRCRKRTYYFEDPEQEHQLEAPLGRKSAHSDSPRKHAVHVLTAQASGSFRDRRSSVTLPSSSKRQREDSVGLDPVVSKADDKADADASTEDSSFNSFQYWRVPLPELDLSLLDDDIVQSQAKHKTKVKNTSVAMET
ncbi:uncharacterized protein ACBR49_020183 [Aulostomus maculatus]